LHGYIVLAALPEVTKKLFSLFFLFFSKKTAFLLFFIDGDF